MGRRLNQTVLAGGVVYPAGTAEADVKTDVEDKFWTGESDDGAGKEPTVKEILAAIGDDKEKAAAALEQEKAGKNRKTLVEQLEALLSGDGA